MLEHFHQILKVLLSYLLQSGKIWEALPLLLLVVREKWGKRAQMLSQKHLFFFPHAVGPLVALSDNWKDLEPPVDKIEYVNGFQHRFFSAAGILISTLNTTLILVIRCLLYFQFWVSPFQIHQSINCYETGAWSELYSYNSWIVKHHLTFLHMCCWLQM